MRTHLFLFVCISFLFTGCLRSLEKEGVSDTTTYKGRVVDKNSKPLGGIIVRVTNGNLIYNSVTTENDGIFQISVDFTRIDKSYYLQIGDEGTFFKRSSLKGFGQNVFDYGDIPFVNINLPQVETIGITAMTATSFTCSCNVKSRGGGIITERGVCWATNIPTVSDNKIPFGSGEGLFSCTVTSSSINIHKTTYYARAYAINEYGVGYGDPVEINSSKLEYFSLPSMLYGGYTYHIHPDLGGMTWKQGNEACEDLVAYGFDDWFLPNREELFAVSEQTDVLDKSERYWTSVEYTSGGCCYLLYKYSDINRWLDYDTYSTNIFRIIPVRKDR